MIIRKETPLDIEAITQVTISAFKTLAVSNHTEQFIIKALRAAGAMTLSLVAEIDEQVVGHIAFSPITISDGSEGWYGSVPYQYYQCIKTKALEHHLSMRGCP